MKCSHGYTPIENAHDVKCEGDKCDEKQCCEARCSGYKCPDKYTSVYGADNIVCDYSGCTTKLCCKKKVSNISRKSSSVVFFRPCRLIQDNAKIPIAHHFMSRKDRWSLGCVLAVSLNMFVFRNFLLNHVESSSRGSPEVEGYIYGENITR